MLQDDRQGGALCAIIPLSMKKQPSANVAVGLPLDLDARGPSLVLIIRLDERNVRDGHLGLH